MTVSLSSLTTLMSLRLSTEQMEGVMKVLTVELAPLEAIRKSSADRQRNVRAKRDGNVTPSRDSSVMPHDARVEDKSSLTSFNQKEDKNLSPSLSKPLPAKTEPDDFAAFMAVYPRRNGAVDRKAALKAFGPALKRADFQTILHGAKRYNADMTATGKIGTEFVKQARTWLNADGWQEYAHTATASGNTVSQVPVFVETPAWKDWTRHLGKSPPTTDIRIPGKQIQRGWYFPTEYPPQEQAA
jgi:hypothetical protein